MQMFEVEGICGDIYDPVQTLGFYTTYLLAEQAVRYYAKETMDDEYEITMYEAIKGHYTPKYVVRFDSKGQKTEYEWIEETA